MHSASRFNGAAAREQRNETLPFVMTIGSLVSSLRMVPFEVVYMG